MFAMPTSTLSKSTHLIYIGTPGILSRGVLLPQVVMEKLKVTRSDAGMLGGGIYFASDPAASMPFAAPSKRSQRRYLLVARVALGKVKQYHRAAGLSAPPTGAYYT